MGAFDIGYGGAFVAGLLSFASPCILPLVPAYLCYISGRSFEELSGGSLPPAAVRRVVASSAVFVLGFTLVFVAMGATASAVSHLIAQYMRPLTMAAGAVIVLFGLHYMGWLRVPWLDREVRARPRLRGGLLGAFILGLAFAFGWTPCVGPVLAVILTLAAGGDSVGRGAALLAAYGLGMGLPFMGAAAAVRPFLGLMRRMSPQLGRIKIVTGGLLVLTGVLIFSGSLSRVGQWMLETFPFFSGVG